jgi:hypothetical protein
MEASSASSNNNIFEISTFRSVANHVFVTPESGIFDFIAISLLPIDVDCRVCPGKCKSSDHVHESNRWTYKEETVMKTLYNVRQKYENVKRKK